MFKWYDYLLLLLNATYIVWLGPFLISYDDTLLVLFGLAVAVALLLVNIEAMKAFVRRNWPKEESKPVEEDEGA